MKVIDTSKLRYNSLLDYGFMEIDDEHVFDKDGYKTTTNEFMLGMKPLGRIYFNGLKNLHYTDGAPVEAPYIDGGEQGITKKYLKAGQRVYTEEMVINIINSRSYDESLEPKLAHDVYELLKELSENSGKDKPARARKLLEKYEVI